MVPSRLVNPAERKAVEIRAVQPPSGLRVVEFSWKSFLWLLHLLGLAFRRHLTPEAFALSVRALFERYVGKVEV